MTQYPYYSVGKPHQLAEILRGEVNEVQIPVTKIAF